MTTAKAGGLAVVGRIVVVHTDEGKLLLQIKRTVSAPMLEVSDSAGNEFIVAADDYERANSTEQAQFYRAKAETILANLVAWN